jgi:hypothetical protein
MPESEIAQTDKSQANDKKKRRSRTWLWWVGGGVAITAGLLVASLPYPHERPESTDKATESFLPSGHKTTFSYPFFAPLVPWTAQWAHAVKSKEYFIYLHVEAQFVDAWGDQHIRSFKLFYRVSDNRWAEYKDPKDAEPIVEWS